MSRIKRILKAIPWPVWLVALSAALWFGRHALLIGATIIAFHPMPVPPFWLSAPQTVREAQLQDLDHFDHVRRKERSWTDEKLARFDAAVADLKARAGSMSQAEFMLGLARAQAIIDNGHSNANIRVLVKDFPHLPIRTSFFGDELRVMRATAEHEALLGAMVTHINGVETLELAARFRNVFGGNDATFRVMAPLLLETPAYLNLAGAGGEAVTLRLKLRDGTESEQALLPVPVEGITEWSLPGDLPLPWKKDAADLKVLAAAGDPLYLRQPTKGYWVEDLPDMNAVYINIRTNMDDKSGVALRDFSAEAVKALRARAAPPRAVIIDLRFNHGGDYTRTHALMAPLGEIVGPEGRIYFLASNNSFSAAIVSMVFAKHKAPDRTIIVGEEIGDRLQFWAEGWRFDLPNSKFRARYATAYYDLQNGCGGFFRCYWGAFYLFPAVVDDLDIDIAAPLSFDAYVAGRDPAMEAVFAAEKARSP